MGLDQLTRLMKNDIHYIRGPLHQGRGTLDKLIAGCLSRTPTRRLTASQAVELAARYAAETGLSKSDIQSILHLSDITRVPLPSTWAPCLAKNCKHDQCVEKKDEPGKVQCGMQESPESELPPIQVKHPVYPVRQLPAWLQNLPGTWVRVDRYAYGGDYHTKTRSYKIVSGHKGYTLAVFAAYSRNGFGSFTIGKQNIEHGLVKVKLDYYIQGNPIYHKRAKVIRLEVTIKPDPYRPSGGLIFSERVSEIDSLVPDQRFLTSPKRFLKVPF